MDICEFYEKNRNEIEKKLDKRIEIEKLYNDGKVTTRHIEVVRHYIILETYLKKTNPSIIDILGN